MKAGPWVALLTMLCFMALACYSLEKYPPTAKSVEVDLNTFIADKLDSYEPRTAEVKLWKATESVDEIQKAKADGIGVVDRIAIAGEQKSQACGEDFLCLLRWAESEGA